MPNVLDDRLSALSRVDFDAPLDNLEGAVWRRVERCRREARMPSPGVQLGLAAAALALGVIMGLGSGAKPALYGSETRVLSDDSIAPSIRLGGV